MNNIKIDDMYKMAHKPESIKPLMPVKKSGYNSLRQLREEGRSSSEKNARKSTGAFLV